MIDLIIIIMAGIVLLFLLSCCFMVARLLDEEISMYGYEGKENWEREQLPDKLSRSSTDEYLETYTVGATNGTATDKLVKKC